MDVSRSRGNLSVTVHASKEPRPPPSRHQPPRAPQLVAETCELPTSHDGILTGLLSQHNRSELMGTMSLSQVHILRPISNFHTLVASSSEILPEIEHG